MKMLLVVALLSLVGVAQAQEVSVDSGTFQPVTPGLIQGQVDKVRDFGGYVWLDLRKNTGFKVDSTIPYSAVDWKRGIWSAGSAVPFFHLGSYVYTGVSASWINSARAPSQASLVQGVRLNDVTRPVVCWVLNKVSFNNLDKMPLLEKIANASSVGVLAGHDFNYTEKSKVVINTASMFFGVEIAFGKPQLKTSSSRNQMYIR